MPSGFQRPQAPGERPEPSRATGVIGPTVEAARGYPNRPAITSLCLEALDGALALVRADGGELALLDASEPVLVTRARRTHPPRFGRGSYGAPSRPSQPLREDSIPDDPLALIDDQITQVLPSAQVARVYQPGQGLIGRVWQRREPFLLRPETTPPDMRQALLLEMDAPHHLAVPIFRPDRLDRVAGRSAVIGALRVFNRDEMWSYTTNDARLLELHVDRLARALTLLDTQPAVRQGDLVATLRELNGVDPTQDEIFGRVADIITRQDPTLSVCALLRLEPDAPHHLAVPTAEGDKLAIALAMRRGQRIQGGALALAEAPPAVRRALQGEVTLDASPHPGANAPLYSRLSWEGDALAQATLAAPIGASPRTVGALLVTAPHTGTLTPDLVSWLEAVALAAAVFLENARLVEEAAHKVRQFDERNKQLSALNNAVLTLNASLDEATSLQNLADQSLGVTSAQVSAVFVRDDENETLVCRAVSPPNHSRYAALLGATIPLDWRRGFGKRLEESMDLVEDLAEADDQEIGGITASLRAVGATSFLARAIAQQERQLGALIVFTPGKSAQLPPAEIALLVSLASQAAVAISNARLYRRLEQAYELQKELDRLKDDFILTVSHEFRTPLTAIEGYVTLISRHGDKLDQEKLGTFATEIHQATTQLAGMISMLADASRMSNQALRVSTQPVSLVRVATDAVSRQPPEAKARIQPRIESALWVMADDERLPLVFTNLISNALKYSGSDKPCRVTARGVRRADLAAAQRRRALEDGAPEEWVVVSVEDEGPGISPDDQARLFQKFVRLQQSLTTSVRGTGLGLWICRQYVEAMGGEIWVESRPGHGARFSFTLPRVEPPTGER
ncbi:MAG TPA: ATP-binding protein [Ktedonobacterales bacterium]|nr:ATP-binding protein [Ktedonobacterales bacterium]